MGQLALVRVGCNDLAVVVACDVRFSGLPRMWRNQFGQASALSNRRRFATAALALALTALGAESAPATPGDILFVEADEASLRAAPEAAAPVILRLKAGRRLIEFERRGAWIRVGVFGAVGKIGWVRKDLAAGRGPKSVGLALPEVMRGPGAARPDLAPLPAPPTTAKSLQSTRTRASWPRRACRLRITMLAGVFTPTPIRPLPGDILQVFSLVHMKKLL